MKHMFTVSILITIAISSQAQASIIEIVTPVGMLMDGQPISAQATFTTGTDSITVSLDNLQIDPTSVVQNISGLRFTLDTKETSGTIVSSSGVPRSVTLDGTYADEPADSTGWELATTEAGLYLYVLGTDVGPSHTIIGPPDASDLYSSANGSIAGNEPHNPFIGANAVFVLDVPGVTEDSTISAVTFEFNTSPGSTTSVIPEPTTMILLTAGLPFLLRRKRK